MSTERVGVRKKPEVNNGQATTGAAAPVEETPNHIVYKKVRTVKGALGCSQALRGLRKTA